MNSNNDNDNIENKLFSIQSIVEFCVNKITDQEKFEIYMVNLAKKDGYTTLKYLNKERQTPDICKAAVAENGLALQFIEHRTEEICSIAVTQNSLASAFVRKRLNLKVRRFRPSDIQEITAYCNDPKNYVYY
jgi:hypothetical protein